MSSAQAAVTAAQSKVQSTSAALQSAKAETQEASQATSVAQSTYDKASEAVTAAQQAYKQTVQADAAYQQAVTKASEANTALKEVQTTYAAAKDQLKKDQVAAAVTEDVVNNFYQSKDGKEDKSTPSSMKPYFGQKATINVDTKGQVTITLHSINGAQMIKALKLVGGAQFGKTNVSADGTQADWSVTTSNLVNDYELAMTIDTGRSFVPVMHHTAFLNLASSTKLTAAVVAGKRLAAEQAKVEQLNRDVQTAQKKANEAKNNLQAAAKVDTAKAKANLQAAQNDFNDAKNAWATAKEKQTTASQNEAAAQKAFDAAQAALKQAQANLATEKQTVENGPAAVAAAQKAVTDAQAALKAAQANLADPQAELTAANARLAAAQAALQKALGQLAIAKAAAGVVDDGATSEPTPTAKSTPAPQGAPTLTTAKVQLTTAQPAAAPKASLPQTGNASASALTVLGMALMSLVLVPFKKFAK